MFDAIISASLRHRVLVLVAAFALIVAGGLSITRTPVDVFPALDKPSVTVMTEAHGLAPEEVETLVSMPLEAAVNGMPGVTRVRSVSGMKSMGGTQTPFRRQRMSASAPTQRPSSSRTVGR